MNTPFFKRDRYIILIAFIISRIIGWLAHVRFDTSVLFKYWQYLDVTTLRHDLLRGVWYDHTQPPFFNLLVGIILKTTGSYAPLIFSLIFKGITIVNALLLHFLVKKLTRHRYFPLIVTLIYLLSPATMIFECELFYTSFTSMLLLTSAACLTFVKNDHRWRIYLGIFLPLAALCLTRSLYHLGWLILASVIILRYQLINGQPHLKRLIAVSFSSILLVSGWYAKNYFIFGNFASSSWIGMNMARNILHESGITDSSRIEAYPPFLRISTYRRFLTDHPEQRYKGLNDRDLLQELKNDSFINEKHIAYIEVSRLYAKACRQYIKTHSRAYLLNVIQSGITFFAPATMYTPMAVQVKKMKLYDLVYSFNIAQILPGRQMHRLSLVICSLPKLCLYALVCFYVWWKGPVRQEYLLVNAFIFFTIGYACMTSSLLEHYENMRFRYEIEPLFLVLLGQAGTRYADKRKMRQDHLKVPFFNSSVAKSQARAVSAI